MDAVLFYKYGLIAVFFLALVTFLALFFISAPYGKFSRKGWGPRINSPVAWIIMEMPAVLTIALCAWFFRGSIQFSWVFLVIWETHYLYRTFIFPLGMGNGKKTFPVSMLFMAILFNSMNGLLNGIYLFLLRPITADWLKSPKFIFGLAIFALGFIIHSNSDQRILSQRANSKGYIIPTGGLFRLVSCPNYLGEIIQWLGWAMLTWSLAGLSFAVFTFANIFPRGILAHKWYKTHFSNYPANRKAVVPFII